MTDNGRRKRTDKKMIRMQVIKAAAEAFSEKGIKNVRMDDIASSLSISKRTLYELFSDKEELLVEVVRIHREEVKNYMANIASKADNVLEVIIGFYEMTIDEFKHTNRYFFEDIKKYPKVVEFLEASHRENTN